MSKNKFKFSYVVLFVGVVLLVLALVTGDMLGLAAAVAYLIYAVFYFLRERNQENPVYLYVSMLFMFVFLGLVGYRIIS